MIRKTRLRDAIRRFRLWADERFPQARHGEWETEYEHWDDLYNAVTGVLETSETAWDEETKELLIYAVARDNEVGLLAERLTASQLSTLAAASIESNESDAKWQFADKLSKSSPTEERESLLLSFGNDANEYVRRRSFMALADCGSRHAERLALAAWDSGDEYQRMACLHALSRLSSPALPNYLKLAEEDGRQHLRGIAEQIKNGTGEYAGR